MLLSLSQMNSTPSPSRPFGPIHLSPCPGERIRQSPRVLMSQNLAILSPTEWGRGGSGEARDREGDCSQYAVALPLLDRNGAP
jgi:hypothetical protein